MAMQVKPDTGEVGWKQRYRVTNWSEYDRALVNRGNLTFWFADAHDPTAMDTAAAWRAREGWAVLGDGDPALPEDQCVIPAALPRHGRIGEVADAPVPTGPAGT